MHSAIPNEGATASWSDLVGLPWAGGGGNGGGGGGGGGGGVGGGEGEANRDAPKRADKADDKESTLNLYPKSD
jgi:hypothetical protein